MQAWWQECLGMESGALFMQRFMDTQMYANHRYSDAIRYVRFGRHRLTIPFLPYQPNVTQPNPPKP